MNFIDGYNAGKAAAARLGTARLPVEIVLGRGEGRDGYVLGYYAGTPGEAIPKPVRSLLLGLRVLYRAP